MVIKFISPGFVLTRKTRDIAKTISLEERNKYWHRSELYGHWLLDKVFRAEGPGTVRIMILPVETGQPNYREADIPYCPRMILGGEPIDAIQTILHLERLRITGFSANHESARSDSPWYLFFMP